MKTLQHTLNGLDKPFTGKQLEMIEKSRGITILGGYPADKYLQALRQLGQAMSKASWTFEIDSLSMITTVEDETVSCKDSASGVKCKKIKKGGHFKPFYQTERY